jgi:hypothetical protein
MSSTLGVRKGDKDLTFSMSAPAGAKDTSGARVSEVLPLVGKTFGSGGREGGGLIVGWIVRDGVSVPAIESSYSPGGSSLIYTYYTPKDADWSRLVTAVLVNAARTFAPSYPECPPNAACMVPKAGFAPQNPQTVSATPALSTDKGTWFSNLPAHPWFWPVVVVGSVASVTLFLSRRK